jgi:hypothetical protein
VDDALAYAGLGGALDISAPLGNGRSPDMRFDGEDFDVVFDAWPSDPSQVFYVAVTADGTSASDPVQRTFSTVLSSSADLEWNGSEYALFAHYPLLNVTDAGAIALTRLHEDGSLNVNTVEITGDDPDADVPSAAWDGQGWGIAYVENRLDGTHPIRFLRTSADGLPQGSPLLLSPGAYEMLKPSVAWTGMGFAVAYVEGSGVKVTSVSGGSVSWTADILSSSTAPSLVVADGTVTVAWISGSAQLATLDTAGSVTRVQILARASRVLDLVWTGAEYGVTYQDTGSGSGTYLVRVGPAIEWVSPPGQVDGAVPRDDARTSVDFSGTRYGLAYTAGPMDTGRVDFRLAGCP